MTWREKLNAMQTEEREACATVIGQPWMARENRGLIEEMARVLRCARGSGAHPPSGCGRPARRGGGRGLRRCPATDSSRGRSSLTRRRCRILSAGGGSALHHR